ncbi:MAG TPA: carboxymuconolactone decarboxylase family protein [Iamia sp.]
MEARMPNPATLLPDAVTGVQQILKAVHRGGAPAATLELVHLRVSQINGCSACVHGGMANAQKAGESIDRLLQLATWRETDLYTPAERAALAVAEAATRLADTPEAVDDDLWADLTDHYDDKAIAAIVVMVAMTNMFNRINTTVREPAGATW